MSTDLRSHRFGAQIDITWMVLKLVNMSTGWQDQRLNLRLHDILPGDPPSPFTQVSQDSHTKNATKHGLIVQSYTTPEDMIERQKKPQRVDPMPKHLRSRIH